MKSPTFFPSFTLAALALALNFSPASAQTPGNAGNVAQASDTKKAAPAGTSGGAAASSAGSASTADRTELLRSMDTDGDGKISPEEFAKYQKAHGGTGLNPSDSPSATPAAPKAPVKGNGDTGQSDALNNTAPSTGKTGSEAGRPVR